MTALTVFFLYKKMHGRFAGPKKASRNDESKAGFEYLAWPGFEPA